jgi:hypothetical protein
MREQVDEKQARGRRRLTNGFGLPALLQLHEQEIITQLSFGDRGGITLEPFLDQTELTVISVAGAIGVIAQGQQGRKARHGLVRMRVIDGIGILASGGADDGVGTGE